MNGGTDPTALLHYLKASGGSHLVSHELVRGVTTARYTSTIDLLKAAESQPSSDPQRCARPSPLSVEYFDFGATPSIAVPPASEVFDATGQTLQSITPGG
jgi:hypothetical protein